MPTLKRWYLVEVNGVIHAVNPPDDWNVAQRLRDELGANGATATIVPVFPAESLPEPYNTVPRPGREANYAQHGMPPISAEAATNDPFGQSGFGGEPVRFGNAGEVTSTEFTEPRTLPCEATPGAAAMDVSAIDGETA